MAKQIKIPVHSFVDLITNSSSEVYVTSDRRTAESVEALVNAILKAGGSTQKCSDLVDLRLESVDGGYGDYKNVIAIAKSGQSKQAADLISKLYSAFTAETIGND